MLISNARLIVGVEIAAYVSAIMARSRRSWSDTQLYSSSHMTSRRLPKARRLLHPGPGRRLFNFYKGGMTVERLQYLLCTNYVNESQLRHPREKLIRRSRFQRADLAVVMLGGNDFHNRNRGGRQQTLGDAISSVLEGFRSIYKFLKKTRKHVIIVLPPPSFEASWYANFSKGSV